MKEGRRDAHIFGLYSGDAKRSYSLRLKEEAGLDALMPAHGEAYRQLDVSILQDAILDPVLGILDVRTDKRIDFVGGIRGTSELKRLVDSGAFAVAFSLYPVTIRDLMDIADTGGIMPPKSTWFEPKLRDGLLSHLI